MLQEQAKGHPSSCTCELQLASALAASTACSCWRTLAANTEASSCARSTRKRIATPVGTPREEARHGQRL